MVFSVPLDCPEATIQTSFCRPLTQLGQILSNFRRIAGFLQVQVGAAGALLIASHKAMARRAALQIRFDQP
jgi:hypothetical protein